MKKDIKNIIILLLLVTASFTLKAQNNPASDTAGVAKLAAHLTISTAQAKVLNRAMHSHQDELKRVMRDTKIEPAEKQRVIMRLMADRHRKVDSLLTPQQRKLLKQRDSQSKQQEASSLAAIQRQHEAQMNVIPHQRTLKRSTTDTVKRN